MLRCMSPLLALLRHADGQRPEVTDQRQPGANGPLADIGDFAVRLSASPKMLAITLWTALVPGAIMKAEQDLAIQDFAQDLAIVAVHEMLASARATPR
jgi:hypothetical protein